MSESGDYDPGPWKGHDFGSRKRDYDDYVGRSYREATVAGKTIADVLAKEIITEAEEALMVNCDQTGSMKQAPGYFFSKAPYLDIEGKEYFPNLQISFGATGDAHNNETYPVQVRPFVTGLPIQDELKQIVLEGLGGGSYHETYELSALYYARKVQIPNARTRPILIFIGDEAPYPEVTPQIARRYAHVDLKKTISTKEIFEELTSKYSVYLIQRPYGTDVEGDVDQDQTMTEEEIRRQVEHEAEMSDLDRSIHREWAGYIGGDNIAFLRRMGRVLDVTFGFLARETGRIAYFREEIEGRQSPGQVATVYKSLQTVHGSLPANLPALIEGRSVMHTKLLGGGGTKTRSLI